MRVLLVDDHLALQVGLRELLSTEFQDLQVEYASSERTALEALEKGHWHIAIVDLELQGKGGLDLIPVLKKSRPLLKVLVYTMHSEQQFGVRAFRCGADGYLTKDARPEDLFLAMRQLLAGRKYLSSQLAELLALAAAEDFKAEKHQTLSNREHHVFRGLLAGKSLSEIAAEINVNIKTVSTYRVRIFEKLRIESHSDLIRYGFEHGLIERW